MTRRTLACAALALALAVAAQAAPTADAATTAARADWSAGPVAPGTGYARTAGSDRVREVQRRLTRLGYGTGPVDGMFGPRTRRATLRFQERAGLAADAIVGRRTLRELRTRDDARLAARAERVRPRAPAEAPGPLTPPPADARASAPVVPEPGGSPRMLIVLLALASAALLAAACGRGRRRRPAATRPDEIVAARPQAAHPPRFTRDEAPVLASPAEEK
jgi:peptidoglycan hydrolase-like protein with peptidoglycan-binding domain